MSAYLRTAQGEALPIVATCAIGRSRDNQIVLSSLRISRHHALIHQQGHGQYWLVDLGSNNGCLVNQLRVQQPTQLREGDRIVLDTYEFVFHQEAEAADGEQFWLMKTETVRELNNISCWLLVADIKGSTKLTRELSPAVLSQLLGSWFLKSKELVEARRGYIYQYLGDGFLAYWLDEPMIPHQVRLAVQDLMRLQIHPPAFRVVVHVGKAAVGVARTGAGDLIGSDVNFVFKIEKLAGSLGICAMLSESAAAAWPENDPLRSVGRHAVPGFDGTDEFFTL
jgi:adenylate cyclase